MAPAKGARIVHEDSDVLGPVRVCGYATVYDQPYDIGDGLLESVAPGAFDLSGSVFATAGHDHLRCFGRTDDGSLEVWSDRYGLAFQFPLQNSWGGISLARAIANGHYRHASVNFASMRVEEKVVAGLPVNRVVGATISELSLTGRPANPATAAWLSTEDPDALPPRIAEARWRWRAGRMAAQQSRTRVQARASAAKYRPPPSVLAAIDAVLRLPRPGWQGSRR